MAELVYNNKGQSIFEYFILVLVVVGAVLFFAKTQAYKQIGNSTEGAFNRSVQVINQ